MTKKIKYFFLGAFVGLLVGMVFGFLYNSFYTKKSERFEIATIQAFIFRGVGIVIGGSFGLKIGDEEIEEESKHLKYIKSLKNEVCLFCKEDFQFSTQDFGDKKYCSSCSNKIGIDYVSKVKQINILAKGIDDLKRKSAKIKRLNKIELLAEEMLVYDDVALNIIAKKPSEILKSVYEYHEKLDSTN
ncbi:hypothetical protein [Spongiivirga citrea]|uniref:Uncharacterized protein n=1 Tax=Spongiivirga citrea TaxID=1481457 RepID=A0A6M0CRV0_9FLAO|nr:hypothetical protein [Spongiivirga citrea]NER18599.1 hypothetical protein [Spongiivirga citrea]